MKLEDVRNEYYFYTGKVSDLIRQVGFAGIGIIWVFSTTAQKEPTIPRMLLASGGLILLSLAADLLQYAVGAVIWDRFNAKKEDELERKAEEMKDQGKGYDPESEDFTAPSSINTVTGILFWVKFVLMLLAYVLLLFYITRTVLSSQR